jgi:hypothetical protein
MPTFLKVIVAALALSAAAGPMAYASYGGGDGLRQACEASDYTPHGVWDCH